MSEKSAKSRLHLTQAESMILYILLTIMLDVICLKVFGLIAKTDVLSDYKPYGSKILGVILLVEMIVFVRLTPMKINWSALRPDKEELKRTMPLSAAISAGIILLLTGYRVFRTMQDSSLSDIPLFGLYLGTHMRYIYPASCVFQEFFIKAFIQENCGALTGGRDIHYTVWITSVFFFILHLQYPFYYMIGALTLCVVTGYLYEKDRNIWGAALIHFTLGFLPRSLGIWQILER